MRFRDILMMTIAAGALAACGPENNGSANNGNNGENNVSNGDTNNSPNASTNNDTSANAQTNNDTSNASTNSSTNASTNASTNSSTNASTNNTTNGGDPLTCNGSFGQAEACGGNPSGTWIVTEACSDYDYAGLVQDACADATVDNVTFDVSGTLAVAGGNFAQAVEGTATGDIGVPADCNILGCDGTASAIETAGAQSADCTDDGNGGCDCTAVFDAGNVSSGTYTTDNGVATLDTGETYYYCASGGTLLLREFGTNNDEAQPTYFYEVE